MISSHFFNKPANSIKGTDTCARVIISWCFIESSQDNISQFLNDTRIIPTQQVYSYLAQFERPRAIWKWIFTSISPMSRNPGAIYFPS